MFDSSGEVCNFFFVKICMDIIEDIKDNVFIVFIILFYFYWMFFINKKSEQIFFALILFFIVFYFYNQNKQIVINESKNIITFIDKIEKNLLESRELWGNIYFIHKTPKKLIYLRKNKTICKVIYDLKWIEIYDKYSLYTCVAYLEYFLKIHYNMMWGRYSYSIYIDILQEIRNTILNTLQSVHFNIPRISKVVDIEDLHSYIQKRILIIQSITGKYVKIIYHKYSNEHTYYKPPYKLDKNKMIGTGKNFNMY